jgi:hypothetical protein
MRLHASLREGKRRREGEKVNAAAQQVQLKAKNFIFGDFSSSDATR